MKHKIKMLKEKGFYPIGDEQDLKKELSDLKELGYDCFYNTSYCYIVWRGFKFEKDYDNAKSKINVKHFFKSYFKEFYSDLKWTFHLICGLTLGFIQVFSILLIGTLLIKLIKHI